MRFIPGMQRWFKIYKCHQADDTCINKMKRLNHMTISSDAVKAFDEDSTSTYEKKTLTKVGMGNIPQHNKGHVQQRQHSQHHTQWRRS